MNETGKKASIGAVAVPLPELDVSSREAAAKTLRAFDAWRARGVCALPLELAAQAAVTRLAIDNMRFPNAHIGDVMKDAAAEAIAKLKAAVESLPA